MEKKDKNKKTTSSKKKIDKVVITEKVDNSVSHKSRLYLGYGLRLIVFVVCFFAFFALSMSLMVSSITYQKEKYINYSEKGNLDYKVNLKKNNYYESSSLGKDMIYVASLIDSIDAYFNYDFTIDDKTNMKFSYSIVGKLRITDENDKDVYLEKEYVLLDNKEFNMTNDNHYNISEKLNINYDKYNDIASGFKATYGVNSNSNFVVALKIVKESLDKDVKINNNVSTQIINIPLSIKAINIKLDYVDINSNSSIVSESDVLIGNDLYITLSIILLILSIFFLLKFIRLLEKSRIKKSSFDKYVNKILREYDRLIVESKTIIDFSNYEIIKVNKFEELLDVRDNLKLPINYYVIVPHQKAYFYIVSNNIYLYVVKEVDLENK